MTLPRLNDLTAYWVDNPPAHISMSTILRGLAGNKKKTSDGYVPKEIPKDKNGNPTQASPTTIQAAAAALGGRVIRRK